jgi:hypothetical protein
MRRAAKPDCRSGSTPHLSRAKNASSGCHCAIGIYRFAEQMWRNNWWRDWESLAIRQINAPPFISDSTADDPHRFEFDLDRAIRDQVIEKLKASPLVALSNGVGPRESGIYALYWKGNLVYVGKAAKDVTKSKRTLRQRLNEHVTKISGRQNITLDEMRCRFLTMESEWWVFAAEFVLTTALKPEWNGCGYGSKIEGRGRPGTERVSRWNQLFPRQED